MFSNKRLLNRKGDINLTILESAKLCTSKQPMPAMVLVSEFPIIWHAGVRDLNSSSWAPSFYSRGFPSLILFVNNCSWRPTSYLIFPLEKLWDICFPATTRTMCGEMRLSNEAVPNPTLLPWCGPSEFKMWL